MNRHADTAVRVSHLSKLYRIGRRQAAYRTFREAIADAVSAPMRRLLRPAAPSADTIWALKDVSFKLRRGQVLGIVGPNGAGKTTLLKVLSRITRPTEGRVELRGRIGSLLEVGTGFHLELTGRENVYLNGAVLGMRRAEIRRKFDEIVAFAGVEDFIDTPIKRYSTGMGTRLAFAIAAHLEPEILAVDEVLSVGDLAFRRRCMGKMQDVSRQGRTVLFVSHEMNAVRRLCETGLWLDRGRVMAMGEVRDVVARYESSVVGQEGPQPGRVERSDPPDSPKRFRWAELAPARGAPRTTFALGELVRLTVGMEGTPAHETHFFEWFINDCQRGARVAWGGSQATPEGDVPGSCRRLSVLIGPLPLTRGRYSVSINMGVGGVAVFDYWHDAVAFEVTGCDGQGTGFDFSSQYAPTYVPYSIEVE
jgi:lipopolysaccharide transport system ATP-binding protein